MRLIKILLEDAITSLLIGKIAVVGSKFAVHIQVIAVAIGVPIKFCCLEIGKINIGRWDNIATCCKNCCRFNIINI